MASGTSSANFLGAGLNPAMGANRSAKVFDVAMKRLATNFSTTKTYTLDFQKNTGAYIPIYSSGSPQPASVTYDYQKHAMQSVSMLDQKQYSIQRVTSGFELSERTEMQFTKASLGDPMARAANWITEGYRLHRENQFIGILVYAATGRTASAPVTPTGQLPFLDLLTADLQPLFSSTGHTYLGSPTVLNINMPSSILTPAHDTVKDVNVAFGSMTTDTGVRLRSEIKEIWTSLDQKTDWDEVLKNITDVNLTNSATKNPSVDFVGVRREAVMMNLLPNQTSIFCSTLADEDPQMYRIVFVKMTDIEITRNMDGDRRVKSVWADSYERIMAPFRGEGFYCSYNA